MPLQLWEALPLASAQTPKSNVSVSKPLDALRKGTPEQRVALLKQIQASSTVSLQDIASAMVDANPVEKNLLLGIAESFLAKDPATAIPQLNTILENQKLDPTLRFWAFTQITKGNPEKRNAILRKGMLDDSALSLRYEAVKLGQVEIKKLKETGVDEGTLKAGYEKLLAAARLPEQIQEIAEELKKLGTEVDLLKHFGFISEWQVIAPFDNRGQKGFDVVYEPEQTYVATGKMFPQGKYEGKADKVGWQEVATKEKDGAVDLNPVFKNEKGAVAYAYCEFQVAKPLECEVRLGCTNANKVWVNGILAFSNEVYHTGAQIDQYAKKVKMAAGKNTVLVKVCQNEQTEQWAQDWKFQLRFTDASGEPIRPSKSGE